MNIHYLLWENEFKKKSSMNVYNLQFISLLNVSHVILFSVLLFYVLFIYYFILKNV